MSPMLFTRYVVDLINAFFVSHIGLHVGDLCPNVLAYADDIFLLTLSWRAMLHLLII
jgi:hypothetical protein